MTKAQQVYERINALVESGVKKADAFRQVAEETGQSPKSLQGSYYTFSRKANGGSIKARRRETTTGDAVADAVTVLERAVEQIDAEIASAAERAQEASAEYEALKASASERKQAIQAKIEALSA